MKLHRVEGGQAGWGHQVRLRHQRKEGLRLVSDGLVPPSGAPSRPRIEAAAKRESR